MVQSRIREIRKERGLTLQEVAELAGTTAQTIGRLETGTRTLSLNWINRISKALGVESASLLTLPEKGDIEIIGLADCRGGVTQKGGGTLSPRLFAVEPVAVKLKENLGSYRTGDVLIFEQGAAGNKARVGKVSLIKDKKGGFEVGLVLGFEADGKATYSPLGSTNKIKGPKTIEFAAPLAALVRSFD